MLINTTCLCCHKESDVTSAPSSDIPFRLILSASEHSQVMSEGVATFGGLSLDRTGRNLRLRFSLYGYDRYTGAWTDTGVHFDTAFFHVEEGIPAALNIEQARY